LTALETKLVTELKCLVQLCDVLGYDILTRAERMRLKAALDQARATLNEAACAAEKIQKINPPAPLLFPPAYTHAQREAQAGAWLGSVVRAFGLPHGVRGFTLNFTYEGGQELSLRSTD
jgi:hypothetical protein